MYETQCSKYETDTINDTEVQVCKKYDEIKVKEEYLLATLTFNNCNNGKYYRIYKHDSYITDKEKIKKEGYIFDDIKCVDNKLTFQIDSFSSYTQEEIDSLQAGLLSYYELEDLTDTHSNSYDLTNHNGGNFNNDGVVDGLDLILLAYNWGRSI